MNQSEAETLFDARSLYCSDPIKISLIEDLLSLCNLYNSINVRTNGEILPGTPWTLAHFRGKFIISQKSYNGLFELSLDRDYLQELLKQE